MTMVKKSCSVSETLQIAADFAKSLTGGAVVALSGDLGAGKTHFAKGVAKGLGITKIVTSPTFTLMNTYNGGRLTLHHFDMYRIASAAEAEETGIMDFLEQDNSVCIIEWPDVIREVLPKGVIEIVIKKTRESERLISITRENV